MVNSYEVTSNDLSGDDVQYYEGRNNYSVPPYHRMDISLNFHKVKKWGERTWTVSIYNLYAHENNIFYFVQQESNGQMYLQGNALFSVLPSVSYRFVFK
jgi:hypothetical protein